MTKSLPAPQDNNRSYNKKKKPDITSGYDYRYSHPGIGMKLGRITDSILHWVRDKTSPGVERARLRDEVWDMGRWQGGDGDGDFYQRYSELCGDLPRQFYDSGALQPPIRSFTKEEIDGLENYLARTKAAMSVPSLQHTRTKPLVFNHYGTGCPFMDIGHILASEAWGANGVVHCDPSWGALTEGLMDGFLTHQEDGTLITPANLNRIKLGLEPSTLWQLRAHRGLNTPETVVLAGKIGADLTKINFCYGALSADIDPARMTVDGYHSILYAQKYNLPFDVGTSEELSGVPAHKAFAGMLIVSDLAIMLGARPILQPLFAYSPEVANEGLMADNYIDFNAAKIYALRRIINAPVWTGAPIGFLTHTGDRVQSAVSTALHACLAISLGVDAVSIASTDQAYSGGPISISAKVDSLRAMQESFRFLGQAGISPTNQARADGETLIGQIEKVLDDVIRTKDFIAAIQQGILGNRGEGASSGSVGKNTVQTRKA